MSGPLTLPLVTLALRQARGVKSEAAAALDVTWSQLNRWMKEHTEELQPLMQELDEMLADKALEVLWGSLDVGGLKAMMFVLERKGKGWARKSQSQVTHRVERPSPESFLPPVVDERRLAVEQSKQLPEPRPPEIIDAEVEPVEESAAVEDEPPGHQARDAEVEPPPGGPYGPCPRCAANLGPPGAWAKAEGHKGSCSSCGYPATQAPQTIAQALQRH